MREKLAEHLAKASNPPKNHGQPTYQPTTINSVVKCETDSSSAYISKPSDPVNNPTDSTRQMSSQANPPQTHQLTYSDFEEGAASHILVSDEVPPTPTSNRRSARKQQTTSYSNPGDEDEDYTMDAPDSPPEGSSNLESRPSAPQQTANSSSTRGGGEASASGGSGSRAGTNGTEAKINFGAPGSSWTTKKFAEEYDRAESMIMDRNWEVKYGDPLYKQIISQGSGTQS